MEKSNSIDNDLRRSGGGGAAMFFTKCLPFLSSFTDDNEISASTENAKPTPELGLLCSYGGQLTAEDTSAPKYRGGENRIISVDRHCSAEELLHRLSTDFLDGRPFTLKYHISRSGLRATISVVTDEDLRFMIEEHDRLASPPPPPLPRPGQSGPPASGKPQRRRLLRVFLLPESPETSSLLAPISPR